MNLKNRIIFENSAFFFGGYCTNIYSLQLYSLHIIFACLYSLLLVIRYEANQSESDPFIRFEANKYSLRYSLIFASKRISGKPYSGCLKVPKREIFDGVFFVHKSSLTRPKNSDLERFPFFSKIRQDI